MYRKALLSGRRYWERVQGPNALADFMLVARNEHPLISICSAMNNHPYAHIERFLSLLAVLGLRFLLTAMVLAQNARRCRDTSGDADVDISECLTSDNFVVSVMVAAIATVFTKILDFLSTCDDRWMGSTAKSCFKTCLSSTGRGIMVCWVCILVPAGLSVFFALASRYDFSRSSAFGVVLLSVANSYTYIWLVITGAMFLFYRWRELQALKKEPQGTKKVPRLFLEELVQFSKDEDIDRLWGENGDKYYRDRTGNVGQFSGHLPPAGQTGAHAAAMHGQPTQYTGAVQQINPVPGALPYPQQGVVPMMQVAAGVPPGVTVMHPGMPMQPGMPVHPVMQMQPGMPVHPDMHHHMHVAPGAMPIVGAPVVQQMAPVATHIAHPNAAAGQSVVAQAPGGSVPGHVAPNGVVRKGRGAGRR